MPEVELPNPEELDESRGKAFTGAWHVHLDLFDQPAGVLYEARDRAR